jgi:hypothetical protein
MKIYHLLLLFLILGCTPCGKEDFFDATLTIVNNSTQDIIHSRSVRYPDTLLRSSISPFGDKGQYSRFITPTGTTRAYLTDYRITIESLDSKTLILYLFSADTIEQVPWERIRDEYIILKRYDLTLSDLDSMNWTITYPQ